MCFRVHLNLLPQRTNSIRIQELKVRDYNIVWTDDILTLPHSAVFLSGKQNRYDRGISVHVLNIGLIDSIMTKKYRCSRQGSRCT